MELNESKPPSAIPRQLVAPARTIRRNASNALSLTDDSVLSQSHHSLQPVPRPRSSYGAPAVSRRIRGRDEVLLQSQASTEFEKFAKETGLASLSNSSTMVTPKTPPKRVAKKVEFRDGVQKVSYSPETGSTQSQALLVETPSYEYIPKAASRRSIQAGNRLLSSLEISDEPTFDMNQSIESETFSQDTSSPRRAIKSVSIKDGKIETSDTQILQFKDEVVPLTPQAPQRKNKVVSKEVDTKDGKKESTISAEQGLAGLYDAGQLETNLLQVPAVPQRRKKTISKSVDLKDGQVDYSETFDEVTLSSLVPTPRDEDMTLTDTPRSVYIPNKATIEIRGARTVQQPAHTSAALASLAPDSREQEETITLQSSAPIRPARRIDLQRSGQRSSNEYGETLTRTLNFEDTGTFLNDSVKVSESKDNNVTSWVEFREGKRHVRHSDERENFSLGDVIEYEHVPSTQPKSKREVHKQVTYDDSGKQEVSYSQELQNTLSCVDDSASWAVRVPTSPVKHAHKRVTLGGIRAQPLRHSASDLSQLLTESAERSYSQSFEEVTVEDFDSYSENWENTTDSQLLRKSRSMTSIPQRTESSISTQTPITSIRSSIQTSIPTSIKTSNMTSQRNEQDKTRTSQLYMESFESTMPSVTQNYSDTWESDLSISSIRIPSSYRRTLGIEKFEQSESEDDYTFTFTQSTAKEGQKSQSSESFASRRAALEACDSFVKNKMRLLRAPVKPVAAERPSLQQEPPLGEEKKIMKRFLRNKLAILKDKNSQEAPEKESDEDTCAPSASCQLRGLSVKENVEEYGISPLMIVRLKAENSLANMKKAVKTEIHEPHKCKHCREKQSELAAAEFMWHKKALVSEKLVQEKLEMHSLQLQDPMWLYAEALRGLPKVSDNADDVFYKLMRPLYETYAGKYKDSLAPTT